jgi:hypothetical protein
LAFLAPTVGSLLRVVVWGLVAFGFAAALGERRDLLRAIVMTAHVQLVQVVGYAAFGFAYLLGNPEPSTSPANVVDVMARPAGGVALSWLDPIAIWEKALFGIGLSVSLGLSRLRATCVAIGLYVAPWLLCVGATAGGQMLKGLFGK